MKNSQVKNNESLSSWYNYSGPEDDIIISSRIKLVRNLADFPFVVKASKLDKERICSIICDAFNQKEEFNFIKKSDISDFGKKLLFDKNIIPLDPKFDFSGLILSSSENLYALVNNKEHLKMTAFAPGFQAEYLMQEIYKLDEYLQSKIQFAASYEFGYLTSQLKDCGSGMKISLRVFIPAILMLDGLVDLIRHLKEKHFTFKAVFDNSRRNCLFDLCPESSFDGSELDQLAEIQSLATYILKRERKFRSKLADNNSTIVLDLVKKMYVMGMNALLLDYSEVVEIISAIKLGLQLKIISGIEESDLNSLYYTTKEGHLIYLIDNFSFSYEEDVKKSLSMQIQRLRAVVVQQIMGKIIFK
ncbi:MAG: hypothetical protein K5866_10420 [Treponema sp.]|nr:hypothetical protein [Treponema sp.]